jgi:hypothetical protein
MNAMNGWVVQEVRSGRYLGNRPGFKILQPMWTTDINKAIVWSPLEVAQYKCSLYSTWGRPGGKANSGVTHLVEVETNYDELHERRGSYDATGEWLMNSWAPKGAVHTAISSH